MEKNIPDRTEIEWVYQPSDFFEAALVLSDADYDLNIADGKATAVLREPQDPIEATIENAIEDRIKLVFEVRLLQVARKYVLEGPRTVQHYEGKRTVGIRICAVTLAVALDPVDCVATDDAGNVIRDTRAERIARDRSEVESLAGKALNSPTLRSLLDSYGRSLSDPSNALVHLYEIRDALAKHYLGDDRARQRLGISSKQWRRVGRLADDEPLEEGRHRGRHPVRRHAKREELDEVREIAKSWIRAFAAALGGLNLGPQR